MGGQGWRNMHRTYQGRQSGRQSKWTTELSVSASDIDSTARLTTDSTALATCKGSERRESRLRVVDCVSRTQAVFVMMKTRFPTGKASSFPTRGRYSGRCESTSTRALSTALPTCKGFKGGEAAEITKKNEGGGGEKWEGERNVAFKQDFGPCKGGNDNIG
ncbi:hypothetical protein B0H34DRAFT_863506 [Crassisporium funariophilum]|nr:hypothetical protein B0H34DRAFT_863506 [Crassisporium funariophilum]